MTPPQPRIGDEAVRVHAPATDVRKTVAKNGTAKRSAADLTTAQFATNCGNATAAPIFDDALINAAYGTNNLISLSDPDIVLINNQWWMIFAAGPAIPRAIAPVAAYLPVGASLATSTTYPSDPNGWHLVGALPNGQGFTPPISSTSSSWDAIAAETPSVDIGSNGAPFIYYSGHNAGQTNFEIGLIGNFNTSTGTASTTLSSPVMTAQEPWEFSSGLGAILEQSVRWEPQLKEYIMYYTAGAWWASPPDNTLAQATSTDGLTWTNRTKLDFPVSYYNQDFVYNTNRSRYEMVISNDPTGAGGANPRNIVWREAATPATKMASWVNETTLLQYNAGNAAGWYNSGALSPSVKYGNLPGETNRIYVFFHAYSQSGDMTIGRFYCDPIGVVSGAKSQTITFNSIPAQTVGSTLTVSATASSGLPVVFSVVQNGNCSISGSVVTFLHAGNCGVIANQAGNSTYAAAPAVGQIIAVNNVPSTPAPTPTPHPTPEPQTISFGVIPAQYLGTSLTVSASASSGLPVSFSLVPNGNCSISGSVVKFLNVGNCGVIANQAGNSTYAAAPAVGQVIVVKNLPPKPIAQTISFGPIPAQAIGAKVIVSATATSGLPVSFSIVQNGNCSISGNVVTLLNAGNCGVVATQAGNSAYAPAPAVGQVIVVN